MGLLDDAIREHLDLKRRRGADPAEIERAEREALGPVRRDAPASAVSELEPPARLPDAPGLPNDDVEFAVEAVEFDEEHPTTIAPAATEDDALPSGIAAPDYADSDLDDFAAGSARDHLDPPTGAPIAGMPPEPEEKPKRRHLFGRRHHEDNSTEHQIVGAELPDDDDPFAEPEPIIDPEAAAEAPPIPIAPAPEPFLDDEPFAEPLPPRETAPGESVGRAQPIQPSSSEPAPPARRDPPALQITPNVELESGRTVEYDVEGAFAEEDQAADDILEETPDFLADTPDHDRLWFEQKAPPDFDFDQ